MNELTAAQVELAIELFKVGAIKFGKFTLKLHETHPDAPLSPIFLNLRTPENPKPGLLTDEIVKKVGQQLYGLACLHGLEYDHVMGIPHAGTPFAKAFSEQPSSGKPISLLKMKKADLEGGKRQIGEVTAEDEGSYHPGDKVVIVDDLVTQAHTKEEADKEARAAGLEPVAVLVLVDREQGGVQELEAKGIIIYYVFKLSQLLEIYVVEGFITQDTSDAVMTYIRENS